MAILDAEYGTKVDQYVRAPSRSRQTKFLYAGLVICVLAVIALLTALCIVVARKETDAGEGLVILRSRQGSKVYILPFGAIVQRVLVPDKQGRLEDVVLGFNDLGPYKDGTSPYFGAVVGRVANRIANGKFTLDGKHYNMSINDPPNSLHGGVNGWSRKPWSVLDKGALLNGGQFVKLGLYSPNGDEGYPGWVFATVTYTLTEDSTLAVKFEAKSGAATPINMAQHSYFNLDGVDSPGTIEDHILQINSSYVTPVNDVFIPTGEYQKVEGTPFDFSTPTAIGKRLSQVPGPSPVGYDTNYVLWGRGEEEVLNHTHNCRALQSPEVAVTVVSPKSGRKLELLTDSPGLQFYSGNQLDGVRGKSGVPYIQYGALVLETQVFPDFLNQPSFPKCILREGELYQTNVIWRFSIDSQS